MTHGRTLALALACLSICPAMAALSTLIGNGIAGFSDVQVNNPYGLVLGPDGALYFCDLDNQRIRRMDLATRRVTTIAGTGERGYHGDGGPGVKAQLRQPHSIIFDRNGDLLICDIGNQRIRRLHVGTGIIETYAGTGEAKPTPEGSSVTGTPLKGPRTMAAAPNGDLYLALREGNAIYRIDAETQTLHRVAGTGEQGYSGDGGAALNAKLAGPKGLAYAPGAILYIADTENHVIRSVNLKTGIIATVLGTGVRGELSRPHGVLFVNGALYVSDSEAHRILVLR